MTRLRCEILAREGGRPTLVRDEAGRVLRLYGDTPPAGARWLGTLDGEAVWGVAAPDAPESAPLDVAWLESPALDEIDVPMGPDRDAMGLFDAPTTGTATGEHTEGPSSESARGGGQRRTAILAWIAAQPPPAADPAGDGTPCEPLKRLVADEPLDPLPALDGVPARPKEPARRPTDRDLVRLAPEREDTATQIEGFETMLDRLDRAADDRTGEAPTPESPETSGAAGSSHRRATGGPSARASGPGPAEAPTGTRSATRALFAAALAAAAAWWLADTPGWPDATPGTRAGAPPEGQAHPNESRPETSPTGRE